MPLFVFIISAIVLGSFCGCSLKPPDSIICFEDGPQHANCTHMVTSEDFPVDDIGHNYTLNGHNWNFDQLQSNSLYVPPESYADIKKFFLEYCHQKKGCDYQSIKDALDSFDLKLNSVKENR